MTTNPNVAYTTKKVTTQADQARNDALVGYTFAGPAVIVLVLFLVLPLLIALFFSFTDWSGTKPLDEPDAYQMVGFANYERWVVDSRRVDDFYRSVRNTVYYVLGVVPIQTMIALVLAVIVNQKWLKGKGFFRTAFYFPSITSSIVVSFIFLFMFSAGGPINSLIKAVNSSYEPLAWTSINDGLIHLFLGNFGVTEQTAGSFLTQTEVFRISLWDWISGPSVAMSTIMALAIWTTTGTLMVIYLSALQNIPGSVYEAAEVDGATPLQIFQHITLPLLRPTTFFVVTLGLIGTFQVFDQIYVLQNPNTIDTTTSIAYLVYITAFRGTSPSLAEASAIAIVLFLIIFVATILQRTFVGGDKAEV
jgi:multiple sugar transport system permease protein